MVKRRVADKAIRVFKDQIRELTPRVTGRALPAVTERLRSFVLGWKAYLRLAQTPGVWRRLDEWMRHRPRAIQLKQWKRGRTTFRELTSMGAKPELAAQIARQARRWWHNSGKLLHTVLTITWAIRRAVPWGLLDISPRRRRFYFGILAERSGPGIKPSLFFGGSSKGVVESIRNLALVSGEDRVRNRYRGGSRRCAPSGSRMGMAGKFPAGSGRVWRWAVGIWKRSGH